MRARAASALVLTVVTAACSGAAAGTGSAVRGPDPLAGVSARLIAGEALAGLEDASSVRISGTFTEPRGGAVHPWAYGPVRNVVNLATGRTACAGTDTVSGLASAEDSSSSTPSQQHGSYRFLRIGNRSWVKGDASFYTHFWFMDEGMSATAGSKYVSLAGDDANVGRMCDTGRWLVTGFTIPPGARPAKAGRVLLSGQAALEIRVTPAEYLYVTDTRTPRLLRVTVPGTEDATFTGYGVPVPAVAPAAQDTIGEIDIIAANR
jgi:hypothetical protein